MANNDFQRKIREIMSRVPRFVKDLPRVAKVEGLQFIADNFKKEGFESKTGSYKKWDRKKKKDASKKILIGEKRGSRLKKSWQQDTTAKPTQVEFTSQLPYAEAHNEGLRAGRPPGFTMPQREMIGPSAALDKRIHDKLDRMAEDIFK